jgi:molybdate transport system regulatory protein
MARFTLRIDFDATGSIGPGKIALLEMIDSRGSIAAAARDLGMSYRRAWLLVDAVNRMFEEPVVSAKMGGKGGGVASLTLLGRGLVQVYRGIERDAQRSFSPRLADIERRLTRRAAQDAAGGANAEV